MKNKKKKIGSVDSEYLTETRVTCKCGHVVNFFTGIPYVMCTHCYNLIFRNKKAEYDYRIKRRFGALK